MEEKREGFVKREYGVGLAQSDMACKDSEEINLVRKIEKRTENLLKGKKGELKQALLDNLAYFEVAASFLNPDFEISKSVENKVNKEINLISKADGFENRQFLNTKKTIHNINPEVIIQGTRY